MAVRVCSTLLLMIGMLAIAAQGILIPGAAAGQSAHDFTVAVEPIPACSTSTTVSGTVDLSGLTTGYGFYVQLRGDDVIVDGQAFEGHDGYPDGTYEWSVSGDFSGVHAELELYFVLLDGEGDILRQESQSITRQCDPDATPSGIDRLPIAGAGRVLSGDRVQMVAFVAVILTILGLLTLIDKPRRR